MVACLQLTYPIQDLKECTMPASHDGLNLENRTAMNEINTFVTTERVFS